MSDAEVVDNKTKKQRSEAQQQAFKRAVEKLKAKREVEREAKAAARAELDLKKTEEKAVMLKERVERTKKPAVVPAAVNTPEPPKPDYSDVLKYVTLSIERVLDERLPKPRAVERSASPPQRKPVMRQPATVHQSMPPAWYEAVFAARR